MADWINWLIAAGVVVIAELFTGTFYLLMIAIGLTAGSIAARLGVDLGMQFIIAAIVGSGATYALRRSKLGSIQKIDAMRDPNVNLDIGQKLKIDQWEQQGEQFITRVMYRGASWEVELEPHAKAHPGLFIISAVRGSRLIVTNEALNNN